MFHVLLLTALSALPRCWDVYDAALTHNAGAAHPPFISYTERISVTEDGAPLLVSFAEVDYRDDDGLARVSDERFDYQPYLTRHAEPGPPELGPYGNERALWLPDTSGLRVIARVRSGGRLKCTLADEEAYKGHDTYHLAFTGTDANRPHLDDLWVDTRTNDIWKLIVTGPISGLEGDPHGVAEFQVELGYAGPYLLVNHVVWSYRKREYSQYVNYFGEYTFSGYAFPRDLPSSYFAPSSAALRE